MSNQTNCVACDETEGTISMQSSGLVSKMYSDVTGLKAKLSYTICKTCHQDLKSFYNFKKRCHDIAGLDETQISEMPEQQQQSTSEIKIIKCEHQSGQLDNGYSQENEDYEYEESYPSMAEDDESMTSYSVSSRLMLDAQNVSEFNEMEANKPASKFNKLNDKTEIIFTTAEVNERIFSEGYPPVYRLLPKNHNSIPGKIPYSELLCEKISAIMPNKSQISVHNGFTIFGETTRAYVRCRHSTKMPATFMQSKLQENQPLRIKVVLKCQECVDEAESQATLTELLPSSSIQHKGVFPKLESTFCPPNKVTAAFESASKDISGILNRGYHLCSAEVDPLKKLRELQEKIETEIVQAWRTQVSEVFNQDKEPQQQFHRSDVKNEEQQRDARPKRPRPSAGYEQQNTSKRNFW